MYRSAPIPEVENPAWRDLSSFQSCHNLFCKQRLQEFDRSVSNSVYASSEDRQKRSHAWTFELPRRWRHTVFHLIVILLEQVLRDPVKGFVFQVVLIALGGAKWRNGHGGTCFLCSLTCVSSVLRCRPWPSQLFAASYFFMSVLWAADAALVYVC